MARSTFNLKMVDTAGGGIKKMFGFQKKRFFPLPDYDLSDSKVKVTIIGKVLDMDFARVLARNPSLSLEEIILLDKVQKKKPISEASAKHLKKLRLVEGRRPNFFISSNLAASTQDHGLKAQYVKQRGFDDDHYRNLIVEYLKAYGSATRKDIDALLTDKLPDVLRSDQKSHKISSLLGLLRRSCTVSNSGTTKKSKYVLSKYENP
ncbi:MAG: hypothetical protein Q8O15_11775 [Rectinemataceae bacterium]|nr:hypothetical protein [Rectinemataceae bacterium]